MGDVYTLLADGPLLVMLKKYFNEEILVVFNQGPKNENIDLDPRYNYESVFTTQPQSQLYINTVLLTPYSTVFIERKIK